ncbi:Dyggve-Melchior-Clausen syndrome protein-domain-containing protein, partial [Blyttiomyces helicus]
DIYFHTNCLASLANMSTNIVNTHSIVAQRIISLLDMAAKRYLKLLGKGGADSTGEVVDPDLVVYGDLVALLLEIVNSVLTHTLKHNPQLVYALLHRRDMFAQFRMLARFGDLVENIDTVITYFHAKLGEADLKMPSAVDVLKVIEQASKTWPAGKLKPFADLKFQYEEEEEYSLFFLPYVWSLVHKHSLIYWDEDKARLIQEIVGVRMEMWGRPLGVAQVWGWLEWEAANTVDESFGWNLR